MKEFYFKPCNALEEIISSFYCFRTEKEAQKHVKCVTPNLEMMLILNFGKPFQVSFTEKQFLPQSIEKFALVGPLRNSFYYEVLPSSEVIVINFLLDGFYRVFKMNLSSFSGDIILNTDALLSLFPIENWWNDLNTYNDLSGKVKNLQAHLCQTAQSSEAKKLGLIYKETLSSKAIIHTLYKTPHNADVSSRTVQINFKKYFGYSVKERIRYERFKSTASYLLSLHTHSVNWSAIVELFGYYDYSHLYKDFKKFISKTPTQFLRDAANFCVPGLNECNSL